MLGTWLNNYQNYLNINPPSSCNSALTCYVPVVASIAPCPRYYYSTAASAISPQVLFGQGGEAAEPSAAMEQWGACTPCPVGTTNSAAGSSTCTPCASGAPCPCAAGFYLAPPPTFVAGQAPTPYVGTTCLPCPAGSAGTSLTGC